MVSKSGNLMRMQRVRPGSRTTTADHLCIRQANHPAAWLSAEPSAYLFLERKNCRSSFHKLHVIMNQAYGVSLIGDGVLAHGDTHQREIHAHGSCLMYIAKFRNAWSPLPFHP